VRVCVCVCVCVCVRARVRGGGGARVFFIHVRSSHTSVRNNFILRIDVVDSACEFRNGGTITDIKFMKRIFARMFMRNWQSHRNYMKKKMY